MNNVFLSIVALVALIIPAPSYSDSHLEQERDSETTSERREKLRAVNVLPKVSQRGERRKENEKRFKEATGDDVIYRMGTRKELEGLQVKENFGSIWSTEVLKDNESYSAPRFRAWSPFSYWGPFRLHCCYQPAKSDSNSESKFCCTLTSPYGSTKNIKDKSACHLFSSLVSVYKKGLPNKAWNNLEKEMASVRRSVFRLHKKYVEDTIEQFKTHATVLTSSKYVDDTIEQFKTHATVLTPSEYADYTIEQCKTNATMFTPSNMEKLESMKRNFIEEFNRLMGLARLIKAQEKQMGELEPSEAVYLISMTKAE